MDLKRLNELAPARKRCKRLGAGPGTGHGKTAGRGHKGQKARSGGRKANFEGGRMPLFRKIPKRGFTNAVHKDFFEIVNVGSLNAFDADTLITPVLLKDAGLVTKRLPVKILGEGEIDRPLTVHAAKFSKSAVEKIEKAGGKVEVVS